MQMLSRTDNLNPEGEVILRNEEIHRVLYQREVSYHTQSKIHRVLCPERPHRQCVGQALRWSLVRLPVETASLVICGPNLHRTIRGAQGYCPMVGEDNGQSIGSTVSDAIVHSCRGRRQLGAPHWAASVALLQVVDN